MGCLRAPAHYAWPCADISEFPNGAAGMTDLTVEHALDVAHTIVSDAGLCMLMTSGPEGRIHARVMQPFPVEPDLTLWFGTSPASRKMADIRAFP